MKKILFSLLAAVALSGRASAQGVDINFNFDLYPDYYTSYEDDIYRYGFNINSYAAQYEDRFVRQIVRDYGLRASQVRRYLRRGYSPSDILFGAELAYRTGNSFSYIMDWYYDSSTRDWIALSLRLGIPLGSARFNLILGSFDRYYSDWGHYYYGLHPNMPPPMYNHSWSYFRPSPTPHRPGPNYRPPQNNRPGPPSSSSSGSSNGTRPGPNNNSGNVRPGQGSGSSSGTRPAPGSSSAPSRSEARPAQEQGNNSGNVRPGQSSTPSRSEARPAPQRENNAGSASNSSSSSVRRSESSTRSSGSSTRSSGSSSRSSNSSSRNSSSGSRSSSSGSRR
ncbi:MAG: hypothetical protein LBM20_00945 [Rikenellaceae bacterium]|jgi:hypothetical protein|nr:hypothetical protein [Rikenellaceae bacterium]